MPASAAHASRVWSDAIVVSMDVHVPQAPWTAASRSNPKGSVVRFGRNQGVPADAGMRMRRRARTFCRRRCTLYTSTPDAAAHAPAAHATTRARAAPTASRAVAARFRAQKTISRRPAGRPQPFARRHLDDDDTSSHPDFPRIPTPRRPQLLCTPTSSCCPPPAAAPATTLTCQIPVKRQNRP